MNVYSKLVEKMQRALRRGGGCTLTHAEMVAILKSDAWMLLAKAERDALIAEHGEADD